MARLGGMLEKKFRVFDVQTQTYGIRNDLDDRRIDFEFGEGICDLAYCINNENFIVEQFLGISDINGKELYENDIVVFPSNPNNYIPLSFMSDLKSLDGLVKKVK